MPEVKICGITNYRDARAAAELGANYIGFVFYPKSPRNIHPELAAEISAEISKEFPKVKKVALFVDELVGQIMHIAGRVGVNVVQLHGKETPAFCEHLQQYWDVWKAIRVKDGGSLQAIRQYESLDTILLDTYVQGKAGGTGESFNHDLAVKAKESGKKIVLAGGLSPENVLEAVRRVNPYAVDISSGVEGDTKGRKDYDKMKRFIEAANVPSVLLDIIERKRVEIEEMYASGAAAKYARELRKRDVSSAGFGYAISRPRTAQSPNIIAEFKRNSPSNKKKGNRPFRENADPAKIVQTYAANGAYAISVIPDRDFDGLPEDFSAARAAVEIPMLWKDFVMDAAQLNHARYRGADAVFLIQSMLSTQELWELKQIAGELGMDSLVETHNLRELGMALEAGAEIIGVNNRDLHTFDEDLRTTLEVGKEVPDDKILVSESAIKSRADVETILEVSPDAMLIGTDLMKAGDIAGKIGDLRGISHQ